MRHIHPDPSLGLAIVFASESLLKMFFLSYFTLQVKTTLWQDPFGCLARTDFFFSSPF